MVKGRTRSVTMALTSMEARDVDSTVQPRCAMPSSAANSGDTSTKASGCNSAVCGMMRVEMPPQCSSVSRYVVNT